MASIVSAQRDMSAYAICAYCGSEIYLGDIGYTFEDHIFCSAYCFTDCIADCIELSTESATAYGIELLSTKEKIARLQKDIPRLKAELLIAQSELDFLTHNTTPKEGN